MSLYSYSQNAIICEFLRTDSLGATIPFVLFLISGDAYHLTSPSNDGRGAIRCMKSALRDADLRPDDICYINAHATSTPVGKDLLAIDYSGPTSYFSK